MMEMPLMPASSVTPQNTVEHSLRQHWIGVLSRAQRTDFTAHEPALRDAEYQLIRAPEIGMTLVRGRMGGSGAPFNVGEMSVTRCVVRLADGRTGYSYLAGRDKPRAELAALADAHLQGPQQARWMSELIEPLAQAHAARRARQEAETAATKVEFFTLVRGEN
jgi:alpha-D-ribose 1-methylphosphonate 5-triphosphate synthase subunit PhnG